jgi:hypothetical protein
MFSRCDMIYLVLMWHWVIDGARRSCWVSLQITKFMCYTTLNMSKDLSISNAITVEVSDTYPQRPKRGDYAPAQALTMKTV